jgi:AcrR family transcriptional regulator
MDTKQRIIEASVKLFNESGIASVRLQQIADEIDISVGNLAYHFRNKEAIVKAVHESVVSEMAAILSEYRIYPNLIDFDSQLNKYYQFLNRYPFYFLDLIEIERAYPELNVQSQQFNAKIIRQIRKRFDFDVQRGVIVPESFEGLFDNLSVTIWMIIAFWKTQQHFSTEKINSERKFKELIWSQLIPHFTPKGKAEFESLIRPLLTGLMY